ncbi:MAG: SGNH/GDSL hydrolase family protein [Actinomycetota bacterium]|nr:SGNH/GDSL hydrolase family protein [Actinomycetota bacterium]
MSIAGMLRLVVLGDSIAYGTGARGLGEAIGPRLGQALGTQGHRVDVQVFAVPGATSRDLAAQVRRAVSLGADLAVIIVGANDLTRLVPPAQAATALGAAVTALRAAGARVIVAPAPDLSDFPAVPPALRPLVHQACLRLQQHQAWATEAAGGVVAPVSAELARAFANDPAMYSADRYHPSSAGYARIADVLAPYVLAAADAHSSALQPD